MPRADVVLVELGLAPSRTVAQRLIAAGRVHVERGSRSVTVKKSSETLDAGEAVGITPDPADRYVSRGALKLEGALARTGVSVSGRLALDVGPHGNGGKSIVATVATDDISPTRGPGV